LFILLTQAILLTQHKLPAKERKKTTPVDSWDAYYDGGDGYWYPKSAGNSKKENIHWSDVWFVDAKGRDFSKEEFVLSQDPVTGRIKTKPDDSWDMYYDGHDGYRYPRAAGKTPKHLIDESDVWYDGGNGNWYPKSQRGTTTSRVVEGGHHVTYPGRTYPSYPSSGYTYPAQPIIHTQPAPAPRQGKKKTTPVDDWNAYYDGGDGFWYPISAGTSAKENIHWSDVWFKDANGYGYCKEDYFLGRDPVTGKVKTRPHDDWACYYYGGDGYWYPRAAGNTPKHLIDENDVWQK